MEVNPLELAGMLACESQSAVRDILPTNALAVAPPDGSMGDLNDAEPEKTPATYVFPSPSNTCSGEDASPPVSLVETGQPEPRTSVVKV